MKAKSILFLLIILALASVEASAQTKIGGSVKGRLLQATGKPRPYTEIELVPVEARKIVVDARLIAVSDTAGNFSFPNVPEGLYTLSVNFGEPPQDTSPFDTFFYPAATERAGAKVFEITAGSSFTGTIFRLPPPVPRKNFTGRTVFSDGRPAAFAWLAVRDLAVDDDMFMSFGGVKTDKNGNFSLSGFVGRRYQIGAILFKNPNPPPFQPPGQIVAAGETEAFRLEATTPNLSLVLKTQEDYRWVQEKYVARLFSSEREAL